jgi:hypothetical protein
MGLFYLNIKELYAYSINILLTLPAKQLESNKYLIIVGNSCEIPNENLPTTSSQLSAYVVVQLLLYIVRWQLVAYMKGGEQCFKFPDALLDFINACQMG